MDSSSRLLKNILAFNVQPGELLKAKEMRSIHWAKLIFHLVAFTKKGLKYFPGMKPINELANIGDTSPDSLDYVRATLPVVIEPCDFNLRTRAVVLMSEATLARNDSKKLYRSPEGPIIWETTLLLTDKGELYWWEAVYEKLPLSFPTKRKREPFKLLALSSQFTLLSTPRRLASMINPNTMYSDFLTKFFNDLEEAIRQREKHLQNIRSVRNEALRLHSLISV